MRQQSVGWAAVDVGALANLVHPPITPEWSATRKLSRNRVCGKPQAGSGRIMSTLETDPLPMHDIRQGSRRLAPLHGEGGSGRHPPPERESKLLPVNTSGLQSFEWAWRACRKPHAWGARLPYIRNNFLLGPFVQALARPPLRLSANSAFQAAPRKIITAESCIQMIKPMTAANPPYTML